MVSEPQSQSILIRMNQPKRKIDEQKLIQEFPVRRVKLKKITNTAATETLVSKQLRKNMLWINLKWNLHHNCNLIVRV